jgi:hypothetical protein
MNTVVVWVMMAYTGHAWMPTLEFRAQDKCEIAAKEIKKSYDSESDWGRKMSKPYCVRIEK